MLAFENALKSACLIYQTPSNIVLGLDIHRRTSVLKKEQGWDLIPWPLVEWIAHNLHTISDPEQVPWHLEGLNFDPINIFRLVRTLNAN